MSFSALVNALMTEHNPDRDKYIQQDLTASGALGLPVSGVEVQPNNFQKIAGFFGLGGGPKLRPLRPGERWMIQEGKNRAAQIKGEQAQRKFDDEKREWERLDRPTKVKILEGRLDALNRDERRFGWEKKTQDYLKELRPLILKLRRGELTDAETRRLDYEIDRAHTMAMRPVRDALAELQLRTGLTSEYEHGEDRPLTRQILEEQARQSLEGPEISRRKRRLFELTLDEAGRQQQRFESFLSDVKERAQNRPVRDAEARRRLTVANRGAARDKYEDQAAQFRQDANRRAEEAARQQSILFGEHRTDRPSQLAILAGQVLRAEDVARQIQQDIISAGYRAAQEERNISGENRAENRFEEEKRNRPFNRQIIEGRALLSEDTGRRITEDKKSDAYQNEQRIQKQVDDREERRRRKALFDAKMEAIKKNNQVFLQAQTDREAKEVQDRAKQFLESDSVIQQYEPQRQILEATRKELLNIAAGKKKMGIPPSAEEQQQAAQKVVELSETIYKIERLQKLRAQILARQSVGGEGPTPAETEMLRVLTSLLTIPKDPAARDDYFKTRLNPLTGDDFTSQTPIPGASIPNAFNQFWWSLAGRP